MDAPTSGARTAEDGGATELLDMLSELQALDRVPRLGYSLRGVADPESVSEHLFHVVFLVWALAGREPSIDRARAVEIALVHDLAEVRFGDLPRTAAERAALGDLLAPLGGGAVALLEAYQQQSDAEARFVRACDKLQMIVKAQVYARAGHGAVDEFFTALDAFDDGGFASLGGLVDELRRRVQTT